MTVLESRRSLLEDLEVIEESIAKRFKRNPELYYRYAEQLSSINGDEEVMAIRKSDINKNKIYKFEKVKRSKKQVMLQQHEINEFLKDYKQKQTILLEQKVDNTEILDPNLSFVKFDKMMKEINKKYDDASKANNIPLEINTKIIKYAMFSASSSTTKPSTLLSERSKYLDINEVFIKEEEYGEHLELESFYNDWLNVIKSTDFSLFQFIKVFDGFLDKEKYILSPVMDRKNKRYLRFLLDICEYIEAFIKKSFVLINWDKILKVMESEFKTYLISPIEHRGKGYFCIVCGKWFKAKTVFESHITGKQHIKNCLKRKDGLYTEYKLHKFLSLLSYELEETKTLVERKLAFTNEERSQELKRLINEYELPAYKVGEPEDDNKSNAEKENDKKNNNGMNSSFDMPLGPDGLPMPYWLYKLQGLDVTYKCELCGNIKYHGRRTFEKHFTEQTHTSHLRCLGIEPSNVFKGVTKIREAQYLWSKINENSHEVALFESSSFSAPTQNNNLSIEVEDADGNVMTKVIYDELKKQGLV